MYKKVDSKLLQIGNNVREYRKQKHYNQEKLASAESAEGSVYMSKVSDIMDQGALGIKTRLVGVVDPQESKDIKLDSDKQLKETFVEVGDEVKVLSGPFAGRQGKVEAIDREKEVATVLVDFLGNATPMEIELVQLERVDL